MLTLKPEPTQSQDRGRSLRFLTVPAAGWDGGGLQAASLRSDAQHHAAVLVLAFDRRDVTFG